jgi:poly(beta-D-mannuronate) lyase
MRPSVRIFFTLVVAVAAPAPSVAGAGDLAAPFATRKPAERSAAYDCAVAPAPVATFAPVSKYGQAGAARDAVDGAAEAAFEQAMRPIRMFQREVVRSANAYHRTGNAAAAACALRHLSAWARADALAGPETHTAWYKLATTISGLSLAYLQIKPSVAAAPATVDADAVRTAEAWLARRGGDVSRYFAELKTPRSSRNNHRAWAGLAAASAGVAANDRRLVEAGMESFRIVVCQASAEGALPLEIDRGSKATEYHLYALAALVPLAEIGERGGFAPYDQCNGALARVVTFTLAALGDNRRIAVLAGAAQEPIANVMTSSRLVFAEPWLARHPDAEPGFKWLEGRRPLTQADLGGNQTLLYARDARANVAGQR